MCRMFVRYLEYFVLFIDKKVLWAKGTLGMFLYQDETFGEFSVEESRAHGLLLF